MSMSKEREPYLNYMVMFAFGGAILLESIGTRNMVGDANIVKERMKLLIFSSPIGLDSKNFSVKKPLNKILKFSKNLKNFGLMLEQVDPCEFAKIINEAHIIFILSNGLTSRPQTSE
jgi:hypothetical protein